MNDYRTKSPETTSDYSMGKREPKAHVRSSFTVSLRGFHLSVTSAVVNGPYPFEMNWLAGFLSISMAPTSPARHDHQVRISLPFNKRYLGKCTSTSMYFVGAVIEYANDNCVKCSRRMNCFTCRRRSGGRESPNELADCLFELSNRKRFAHLDFEIGILETAWRLTFPTVAFHNVPLEVNSSSAPTDKKIRLLHVS